MIQWSQVNMTKHQAVILEIKGELDTEGVKILEPVFLRLCDETREHVVMDCTQLRYVNSQGLGLLVTGLKKSGERGHKLILAGLQDSVRRLFEVVRFNRIFSIFDTVGQALNALEDAE